MLSRIFKIFKRFIWSCDFIFSVALAIGAYYATECSVIKTSSMKDIFGLAVSVLSIVFSVFFASLAILMTSSDHNFIKFLENGEVRIFTELTVSFKVCLLFIFLSLIFSILLYAYTSLSEELISPCLFALFAFSFIYSLMSTFMTSIDAIQFSKYRTQYISECD